MTTLIDRVGTIKMKDNGNEIPSPEFNISPKHGHPTQMTIENKKRSLMENTFSSSNKIIDMN